MTVSITSLQNERVKSAVKLRQRSSRDRQQLFLIEGYRELYRAVHSGRKIRELFFCSELFLGTNEPQLIEKVRSDGALVLKATPSVFQKLSYRDRPDGLLAVAEQHPLKKDEIPLSENPFLVVAESIEKPGNLGTILRSCDAAGADGLIVCDRCTDIHNPNVVRASVGTLFTVPVAESDGSETLSWLKQQGIQVVAATPSARLSFTESDLSGPIAIAVGTEQLGLSEEWMDLADIQVGIPMNGVADSLNVATATTLLLYEVLRQRQ